MSETSGREFWREVFTLQGAATLRVLRNVLIFGWIATMIYLLQLATEPDISIEIGPHEVGGAILGLLLAFRTNAGYERWWEARRLWGGITNQSRNLVLAALSYGPASPQWRGRIARWTAAFAHAVRARLRGEQEIPELPGLLSPDEIARARAAAHVPNYISARIAHLLREAADRNELSPVGLLAAEQARAGLIDHLGGCERIRNTPLPAVYTITLRRFIFLFLVSLPFALLHKLKADWLTPGVTAVVAYVLLALDHIGVELRRPFSTESLSHLPLDEICGNIQRDLLRLAEEMPAAVSAPARSDAAAGPFAATRPGAAALPAPGDAQSDGSSEPSTGGRAHRERHD